MDDIYKDYPHNKNMKKKKKLFVLYLIILIILSILTVRLINPREIDDVSPEIKCEKEYIQKSDILWVIPKYNNKPISEDGEWCEYILSLNKTIGMHGITHERGEFSIDREQEYFEEGLNIFEECFGFKPKIFKAPQLNILEKNKILIRNNNLKIMEKYNQFSHKVYHCNNTGFFSNKIINLF